MHGGDELYRVLVDRCQSLEVSHEKLREQFNVLLEERNRTGGEDSRGRNGDDADVTSCSGWLCSAGVFYSGNPFRKVLEHMGHAVFVSRGDSEEIIYWNRSAERLFGYEDYEALGQKATELLIQEGYQASAKRIMGRLMSGKSWSGQFPFRRRSGQVFMAIVTKSPLYEDNELVGVVTVSSDAALFNNLNLDNKRTCHDPSESQSRVEGINLKKIHWQSPPQIASSVSNLASKVLSRKQHGDSSSKNTSTEEFQQDFQNVKSERPPRAPAARLILPIG